MGPEVSGFGAWLLLAVGDDRQHGGNDGYDDLPSIHYSWDDTVPNHDRIRPGDRIALWDKRVLKGASVVDSIEIGRETKTLHACPACHKAGIKARKTKAPRFKCYKCAAEFDTPQTREAEVNTYRSHHEAGWVNLEGNLSGPQLRRLCVHPSSQLSLRRLRWNDFRYAIETTDPMLHLAVTESRADVIASGHRTRTVRVRVGQRAFRQRLLHEFGDVCAFSGPAPRDALEACHLYSYAEKGRHHEHGGLILRRDLHRLFDLGHLAVDPETLKIDISPVLGRYRTYSQLGGGLLLAPVNDRHRAWLLQHWELHRAVDPGQG